MRAEMRVTALLPMKGASERVPGKNVREACGKPLFFHIAEMLEHCPLVESIRINTDSEAIADLAQNHFSKAVIHWRPAELCGDMVSINRIIAHDLALCPGEHFLQTHCTNPLLMQATLEDAILRYAAALPRHDSLFSVTRLQTRLYTEDGQPLNHDPSTLLRTQDLPPLYEENSNIYLFSRASFSAAGENRIGRSPLMFPMAPHEAVDIDEEHDFLLATLLLRMRAAQRQQAATSTEPGDSRCA